MHTPPLQLVLVCSALLIALVAISIIAVVRLFKPSSTARSGKPQPSPAPSGLGWPAQSIQPARKSADSPYAPIPQLLTPAERDFHATLQAAVPDGYALFAQVRLAGLVQVKPRARRDKSHWWRIQAKCVDFVLCDARTTAPCLVIELDDSSHNRADRQARDAFVDTVLAGIGLPILHVRWQARYDPRDLAERIAEKLGLAAPARSFAAELPVNASFSVASSSVPTARLAAPARPLNPAPASDNTPAVASSYACGQCQAAIRPDARFCSRCGATLSP
jgi:very-short-patch-repair endonuclease